VVFIFGYVVINSISKSREAEQVRESASDVIDSAQDTVDAASDVKDKAEDIIN
jgi:ArsR family metal-binding transcriptional regulator